MSGQGSSRVWSGSSQGLIVVMSGSNWALITPRVKFLVRVLVRVRSSQFHSLKSGWDLVSVWLGFWLAFGKGLVEVWSGSIWDLGGVWSGSG